MQTFIRTKTAGKLAAVLSSHDGQTVALCETLKSAHKIGARLFPRGGYVIGFSQVVSGSLIVRKGFENTVHFFA